MRLPKRLGMILLGVWLILTGLIAIFGLSFSGLPIVMAIIAIISGILIVFGL